MGNRSPVLDLLRTSHISRQYKQRIALAKIQGVVLIVQFLDNGLGAVAVHLTYLTLIDIDEVEEIRFFHIGIGKKRIQDPIRFLQLLDFFTNSKKIVTNAPFYLLVFFTFS